MRISDVRGAYYYRTNSGNQVTTSGGRNRLDMKYVFAEILPYFESKEWSKKEKKHMLAFLADYMFWSINVTSDEYLPEFVEISHDFFKHISFGLYLRFFFGTKVQLRDKLMIWFLKSPRKYKTLSDREAIHTKMEFFKKIKRVFGK